ncbi:hypothetical protein HK405_008794, partial [Cladochytrium tenue]
VGERYLVSVNKLDELILWNLATREPRHRPFRVGAEITALEAPAAAGWLYLGLASGKVIVFDLRRNALSEYAIPAPDIDPQAASADMAVTALSASPTDSNQLLIAYASGHVSIWSLSERRIHRRLSLYSVVADTLSAHVLNASRPDGARVGAARWRPDGRAVVASHGQYLVFWDLDGNFAGMDWDALNDVSAARRSRPTLVRTLDGPLAAQDQQIPRQPIHQIEWFERPRGGRPVLLVSGGGRAGDLRGVSLLHSDALDAFPPPGPPLALLAHDANIVQFCAIPPASSPSAPGAARGALAASLPPHGAGPPSPNDLVLLTMTQSGVVKSHAFHYPSLSFSPLSLSPSLTLLATPEIVAFCMETVPQLFLDDLRESCSQQPGFRSVISNVSSNTPLAQPSAPPTPLSGGSTSSSIIAAALLAAANSSDSSSTLSRVAPPDVLVTAHADSTIRFWHPDPAPFASPSPPVPLVTLPLTHLITMNPYTSSPLAPTTVYLDSEHRTLIVSSDSSIVVLRHVSLREAEEVPSIPTQAAVLRLSADSVPLRYTSRQRPGRSAPPSIRPRTSSANAPNGATAFQPPSAANLLVMPPDVMLPPSSLDQPALVAEFGRTRITMESSGSSAAEVRFAGDGLEEVTDEEAKLLLQQIGSIDSDSLIDFSEDHTDTVMLASASSAPASAASLGVPPPVTSSNGGFSTPSLVTSSPAGSIGAHSWPDPTAPGGTEATVDSAAPLPARYLDLQGGPTESEVDASIAANDADNSSPRILIDRFKKGPYDNAVIPGWATIVQAVYPSPICTCAYASWLNIMAAATADGNLTAIDIVTGLVVMTDDFGRVHDGSANEAVILHFADTYVDKEPDLRPVLFAGTADGNWFMYVFAFVESPVPGSQRYAVRRVALPKARNSVSYLLFGGSADPPGEPHLVNRPLSVTVLDAAGAVVTQQIPDMNARSSPERRSSLRRLQPQHQQGNAGESRENYVVLAGSRRAEVILLEPGRAPRCIAARVLEPPPSGTTAHSDHSLAAEGLARTLFQAVGADGPSATAAGLHAPPPPPHGAGRGPGSRIVAAGVATVRGEPCLVAVARDSSVVALGLPGLAPATGLAAGAAGGGGWGLGPRRVRVLRDARIACWSADRELKVVAALSDPARFLHVEP